MFCKVLMVVLLSKHIYTLLRILSCIASWAAETLHVISVPITVANRLWPQSFLSRLINQSSHTKSVLFIGCSGCLEIDRLSVYPTNLDSCPSSSSRNSSTTKLIVLQPVGFLLSMYLQERGFSLGGLFILSVCGLHTLCLNNETSYLLRTTLMAVPSLCLWRSLYQNRQPP